MSKKIILNIFIFFILYSSNVYSSNIAVINLEFIFNEINQYKIFIEKVELYKKKTESNLKIKEKELINQNKEIESSSLILNDKEMNQLIETYQLNLSNFQKNINKHNLVINSNIDKQKNYILNEIANICKKVSLEKNFDIILTQNNYFLSSEKIDISNIVIDELNKLNLILDFNININD